jgi:hypothetical protein
MIKGLLMRDIMSDTIGYIFGRVVVHNKNFALIHVTEISKICSFLNYDS